MTDQEIDALWAGEGLRIEQIEFRRGIAKRAIEAMQGERNKAADNAIVAIFKCNDLEAERDALQAKLDELQRQEPVGHFLSNYGEEGLWLCCKAEIKGMTEPLYAAPKALEPESLTPDERQQVVELLDKEGHDGKDFEPECPLCTARQKLAHGITKGTPT